jgi:hypothetical protein
MIRLLLTGLCATVIATIVAWFLIPASTYVEDALGILMATFIAAAAIAFIVQRLLLRRKNSG